MCNFPIRASLYEYILSLLKIKWEAAFENFTICEKVIVKITI